MRSLHLDNVYYPSPEFLSILRACPMIEDVSLNWEHLDDWGKDFEEEDCEDLLRTCWTHLKSFCLGSYDSCNERTILSAVAKLCGKTLRNLTLDGVINEEDDDEEGEEGDVIKLICESFEQLEVLDLVNNVLVVRHNQWLENFQNAKFRNTLHTFKLYKLEGNSAPITKLDYGDILQCFPQLKVLHIGLEKHETLSAVDILKQIEELEINTITSFPASITCQFVSLKSLRIEGSAVTQALIRAIFTLPNLQSKDFDNIENRNPQSLFLPITTILLVFVHCDSSVAAGVIVCLPKR